MTVQELLDELSRRGIKVWSEGAKLRYDAPRGALDAALRARVVELRAQLLEVLQESAEPAPVLSDRNGELPLSHGQQRLWFLNRLAPSDQAYNVPATVRLRGPLDTAALQRALDEIARRHETLRSRMPEVDGKATLVIEPAGPVPVEIESLSDIAASDRLAEATRRAREDAVRPFDLENGPLLRITLFPISDVDHVLQVVMHHIVSDGWSMGVFFKELAALYGAFRTGQDSPLPELPLQYVDHAAWQQSEAGSRSAAEALAWWVEQLGDEPPVLELPTDRPRPVSLTHHGGFLWFPVKPELRVALQRVCQREGVTRFQLLLTAFYVLLARHTGQEDIVIGTPVAGRSRREIEGLIGFFVNNLVLRADLSGDPTFRELLQRVRSLVLDAFSHQETPFEKIVESVSPERELGRNPLFQVLFNHFDLSEYEYALPPLELSTIDMTLDVSKFDLTLHCFEQGSLFVAKLEYDTALFDAETVNMLGERYITLLRGMAEDPGRRISDLPVLTDDERSKLLVTWNRTGSRRPDARSVHGLFEAQALSTPEAPAVAFEGQVLSYAELDRRATLLAERLADLGVGPNVRVALFLERSHEMIVSLLGVLKAGGAYVPIDATTPPARVEFILRDADCRVLVTQSSLSADLPPKVPPVLHVDQLTQSDGTGRLLPQASPGQLAYVIYTSGSTGGPKGVEVEHAQVLDYVETIRPRLDVPADSHFATVSTLAADLGNTCIFPALCGGGCLHVMSESRIRDGDAFAEYMDQHRVDVLKIVPGHLQALLDAAERPAGVLPEKLLVLGGEACTWELVDRVQRLAPACEVVNHYGPAETTVGVVSHRLKSGDRDRFPIAPPLGRPLENAQIYLVDKHRQPVPIGCVGEILVGGGGVTRGYCNRPDLTSERFVPDPFRRGSQGLLYCTGDLARFNREGELVFVGRADEQVKVRGHRVELAEVCAALERHDDVLEAAAIVRESSKGIPQLVAYIVPRTSPAPGPEELRAFLKQSLPDYMLPAASLALDALPLTANGKLDRRALPDPDEEHALRSGAYVAPRTPAEQVLARIWCDVLRLDRVGVHDNFFELGGESILSIQIISRANRAGLHLRPRDIFERGTIAELAATARESHGPDPEQGPITGAVPLTPVQWRFLDQELEHPWHYNHAMLLCVREPIEPRHFPPALAAIERQHDALRLRVARNEDGWRQTLAAPDDSPPFEELDLSSGPREEHRSRIEAKAADVQAQLDLERGPIWRAVLIRTHGDLEDRLLVVIHHLAVDGVSWRLLLEDLVRTLRQLERGDKITLPAKTQSFKAWAQALVDRAARESTLAHAGHWLTEAYREVRPLPLDRKPSEDSCRSDTAATLEVTLDAEETDQLLHDVPSAYHTRIHEVLLAGLAKACTPWTGSQRLLVDVEGHGREDLFDGLDFSRTVGWFTSVHPVALDTTGADGPGAELCAIKEQLRAAPDRGVGWGLLRWLAPSSAAIDALRALPRAQIGFNFMGHFDRSIQDTELFCRAPESPGLGTSLRNKRRYLLDVGGSIVDGRLHVTWTWSRDVHDRATIEALAQRFLTALRQLIAHCTSPGAGGYTPSDFPLARIDTSELSMLEQRFGAANIEAIYPMSPLQRGMVFHTLADQVVQTPDDGASEVQSPTYVTQLALTLHGELAVDRFRTAWQHTLDHNPILRTALLAKGLRELHQIVCRSLPLRWSTDDWSTLDEGERCERLQTLALEDRRRGFQLDDPPLMRLRLIRIGPDQHRLIWTHHHALLDGWSLPLLIRDVFTAYASADAPALEDRRPFSDYIRWLEEQDEAGSEAHWRTVLDGWTGPTPLPASAIQDGFDADDQSSAPARATELMQLSLEATEALETLARRQHLTVSTFVQGAWGLLLARHAAQTDVLFGVTVSGRPPDLPGVERMLGLFINTLPLRVDASDADLLPWLKDLQSCMVDLQQHQASPLYEIKPLVGMRGQAPLFESLVVFENYPVEMSEPIQSSGLRIEDATDVSHATYPLVLVVQPRSRLFLELRYDTRRYDAPTIRLLLQHLTALLEGMGSQPETSIARLPMVSAEERAQLVHSLDARGGEASYPRDAAVPDLFAARARATPEAPALSFGGRVLTYAELDIQADLLARDLHARGARKGDLVALHMERGPELVVGMLGALKAGAAYLPMAPQDPALRTAFILRDSGARFVIVQDRADPGFPDVDGIDIVDLTDLLSGTAQPVEANLPSVAPPVAATDLAYVIYTSGSTGEPKGTGIPHRGITRLVRNTDYVDLQPSDRIAHVSAPSFDAATFEIWGALLNGGCVVGLGQDTTLSPAALAQALRTERISTLFVTTALFNQLVRHEPAIFAPLRYVLFGGEAVSPQAVRTVLENGPPRHLLHVYGPTECTTFSTWHEVTNVPLNARTVPIGRSVAHSSAYVLDSSGQPSPLGAPGELYIGGDGLAIGYHRRPELTAERFVPNPFSEGTEERLYRTGDLVRQRTDGALEFLGRLDHQIKLRGFRIELGEIEATLLEQPGVKAAVVLCREDEPGDKQLVAYVVTQEAGPQTDELRAALARELPDFMVPAVIQRMPALPVNKHGKIDRQALPAPDRKPATVLSPAPRSALERRIAGIWSDVLGVPEIGTRDNFFDLGGHSLKLLALHVRLVEELGAPLSVTDLFQHTTVEAQARALGGAPPREDGSHARRKQPREAGARAADRSAEGDGTIAIVGMTGRFPGSPDVDSFWRGLCDGVESVRFFTDEELRAAGVPEEILRHPAYVPARAILDDPDLFDARFFGYTPLEAELMDPQQRLFLESCHQALELACIDPDRYGGRIGVFGGASMNSYLEVLRRRPDVLSRAGGMAALISSMHDFLTTRVSYQLNLHGPSVNVQTACSTSLVAVHEACRSLIEHRCDAALAGGVSVTVPWTSGYVHEASGVRSSDGHCRTFDARADGMVSGNGVGIVVLKRLPDALADGDDIHALILGSAINNDGSRKVGFTAPSIEGQAEVIAGAQSAAGIDPRSIGYIECHGTATALGDPIEVAALTGVFRERTPDQNFCALASLKSNMGHLDAAAGVAGLIKTALAVRHGRIPPSLHFEAPNPEIDFPSSPFFVNTTCREWNPTEDAPRRAGVSAFGIGGTNAHAVLEQPPVRSPSGPSRAWQLLQLSAKTPAALDLMTSRLAQHLHDHPEACLADVAHSLRTGRRELDHRRTVLCQDGAGALASLEDPSHERCWTQHARPGRPVVFLFPGQGAQYVGMGRGLYRDEPVFREVVDECLQHLSGELELDLESVLFADGAAGEVANERLTRTLFAQPALFVIEYALARLWLAWGVTPVATIGHSIGEYVSACLAGVLDLPQALRLVVARSRVMDGAPEGGMLAVRLTEEEVLGRLSGRDDLWLAAVNGPCQCVVSGENEAVVGFANELRTDGVPSQRLSTSHAFHSGLMDQALEPFLEEVRATKREAPQAIPYVSSLTGDWVTAADVADETFWTRQMREPVQWSRGLARLLQEEDAVLLEVGPGRTLATLARAHGECHNDRVLISSLPAADAAEDDSGMLLGALGRLWTAGVDFDAAGFTGEERRHHVVLPTYPFERERYWVEDARTPIGTTRRRPLDDWFYSPVWRPTRLPDGPSSSDDSLRRVLVFAEAGEPGARIAAQLAGDHTVLVRPGTGFGTRDGGFTLAPDSHADHQRLIDSLRTDGALPELIVHAWSADHAEHTSTDELERGFLSLVHLVRALSSAETTKEIRLVVVTSGLHAVTGRERIRPERASSLGVVRVAALEQPDLHCRLVDLDCDDKSEETLAALSTELRADSQDPVVALRDGRRWVESFAPVPLQAELPPTPLRQGGVYMITGGMGGMGLALARELARSVAARLVLVGRTLLPERAEWDDYLASHPPESPIGRRIRAITELEAGGCQVLAFSGDVSDAAAMSALADETRKRFGALHGVIHAAGVPPSGLLMTKDSATARAVLAPKVAGTRVLMHALADFDLDFVVLCSSLNVVKGFPGAADYSAANAFLDAYARALSSETETRVVSIAWSRWRESGMAVEAFGAPLAAHRGISDAEGAEVFRRILAHHPAPNVLVSEFPLHDVLRGDDAVIEEPVSSPAPVPEGRPRPELSSEFVAPTTETERVIAGIWQELLGYESPGVHDDFFELGGDSLLATQLLGRLLNRYPGAGLKLRTLFDRPSIHGQAAHVESARPTAEAASTKPGEDAIVARGDSLDPEELDSLSDDEVTAMLKRLTEE